MERSMVIRQAVRMVALVFGVTLVLLPGGCAKQEEPTEPPRLTVLLIVDQMRADLLDRFGPDFDSGFARILEQGRRYDDAHHRHAYTWTAAGHSTLATGVDPSRHGVIGNYWWGRDVRRHVGAAQDVDAKQVGAPSDSFSASSRMLRVPALGDWLKQASSESRVWSVALKDRSAAPAGGHGPDGAYWYDKNSGRFITSDRYFAVEPDWVTRFHEEHPVDEYRATWELLAPSKRSREDAFAGETEPSVFPKPAADGPLFYDQLRSTPAGDRLTLSFTSALIEAESLGADAVPDLLILSMSAADYVGHAWGPRSVEIEDHYRRLDRTLGELLDLLDAKAGAGNWLLVLTSDHGVVPLPEQSVHDGKDAARVMRADFVASTQASLSAALTAEGLADDAVTLQWADGWFFDQDGTLDAERLKNVRRRVADDLLADVHIEDVFTWDELASDEPLNRPFEQAYRRSFDAERSPDLGLRFREFDLLSREPFGTNHGSPYSYDSHVPMIFVGAGVTATRVAERSETVDVAPTLAACLGIEPAIEVDGRILPGICDRPER